jgi:Ankyrin repeats (many copies)
VNENSDNVQPHTATARIPVWLRIIGIVGFIGSAVLAARLIWEQTVWTWERGPQMVGFSLVHGRGAILLVFPPLLILWTAAVAMITVWNLARKTHIAAGRWAGLTCVALVLVLMMLPAGFWQRVFVAKMASSPRARDLVVYAAYRGDLGTVRAMVSHGVPVGATNHSDWRTALHGAAVAGSVPIIRYLVSAGADLNALDRSGDSPLELAASRGQVESAKWLASRGAKRIRGDEAQHQKAIHDEVADDIDEMNRARRQR